MTEWTDTWCTIINTVVFAMLMIFLCSLLFLLPQENLNAAKNEDPDLTQNTRFETVVIANATLLTLLATLTLAKFFSYIGDTFVDVCMQICTRETKGNNSGQARYTPVLQTQVNFRSIRMHTSH